MAPAVTSDTAPCSRAPCRLTRDSTSLLSVALVDLGEAAVNMSSQTMPSSQDGNGATGDALGTVPFHPFARLSATRPAVSSGSQPVTDASTEELNLVDGAGQESSEMVNGVGVSLSQNLSSLSLSNACRLSLKSVPPRTVNIIIKNNGACSAGIVSNRVLGPVLQTTVASGNCNGGNCLETNVIVPQSVQLARPHGTRGQFVARPVRSLPRMLIRSRDTTAVSCAASSTSAVTDCTSTTDATCSAHSGVEQSQVVYSTSDVKQAASNAVPVPSMAQPREVTLDAVLARQRSLLCRADRTLMRLRRLQSREANSSVRRQVAGLVSALRRSACQSAAMNDMSAVRSTPDLKSMSTLELVGFVRQMQSSEAISTVARPSKSSTLQLSICPDMAATADQLSSNVRHLESAVDSDATESSSGGETDDEVEPSPAANDEYIVVSDS